MRTTSRSKEGMWILLGTSERHLEFTQWDPLWTSDSQSCKILNLFFFKPLNCGNLLQWQYRLAKEYHKSGYMIFAWIKNWQYLYSSSSSPNICPMKTIRTLTKVYIRMFICSIIHASKKFSKKGLIVIHTTQYYVAIKNISSLKNIQWHGKSWWSSF